MKMFAILFNVVKSKINISTTCQHVKNKKFIHLQNKQKLRKSLGKREEVKKIQMNILTRYLDYVKNYDKVIEKRFPTAMNLYRTFKGGVAEFYNDLKLYITIIRKLNSTCGGLKNLSLNEIVLYHKMPTDMIKVAPVLLFSMLPFTNYIVFPLTYYFPRQLLCSHFWTLQQRSEFQTEYLRRRLLHYRPTFRHMQTELNKMKKDGHVLFKKWAEILGYIGSGVQPTCEEIIECEKLFNDGPYNLYELKISHVKSLLQMHGMSTSIWFRRKRLKKRAKILREMDKAILRETGPCKLKIDALRYACFIRGLSPINMKHEDMVEWLEQWLDISEIIHPDNSSLLLHLPILLVYNHPSNWQLIYK